MPNSNNLGDRIIAESLKHIIQIKNEEYIVTNFDLTNGTMKEKKGIVNINLTSTNFTKKIIPDSLRRIKVSRLYKKNLKLRIELKRSIAETDIVVIGGGHLLIDNYLNFPIGISNIIKEAKIKNIPVIFAFVGAKGPWSKEAKKLFIEGLDYASHIVVRDTDSKNFLLSVHQNIEDKILSMSDPALYVKEMYEVEHKNVTFQKIGLGIMDPNEIKRHSNLKWSRKDSARWWSDLAKRLISLGYEVSIFTNGASTDNGFVEYYLKKELSNINEISFYDYPSNYKKLINTIFEQDIIVAQRLHACLPAISFGKPTFGLLWDKKLESIFKELGLSNNTIDFNVPLEITIEKIRLQLSKNNESGNELDSIIETKKKEMLAFVDRELQKSN